MTFVKIAVKEKLTTLALALLTTAASAQIVEPTVAPGAYIVEFTSKAADTPTFYSNISGNAIDATPRLTLSHELFNGASFVLEGTHDNDTSLETILQMDIVSKIWPVRLYTQPEPVFSTVVNGVQLASTPQKRAPLDTYSPHVLTGVDKLRAEGFTGEGIHIGIIDTGVDYNHPALGGGFGPGFKIAGGYDLVGDNYTGLNTPVPDPYPNDCNGHGTHISGIIGANENPLGFTGVVPNATLSMWRIFGCDGFSSNDILIQAYNTAHEAGVDLISASIGLASGWVEDVVDIVVQRIVENGTPFILAAGNDGENGLFYTSAAGEAIGAIAAGSVNNIDVPIANLSDPFQPNIGLPGFMSTFTSWGPSLEAWIKPDVSAPGGNILSTYPLAKGGYAILSGTSMATPFVSGVAALIQQVRGQKLLPAEIRALLASAANPLRWSDFFSTSNFLAPVIQQGGGIVNAYKAAHTQTIVNLDKIALNDTENFQAAHPLTISNVGPDSVTYNFSNVVAATAYTNSGSEDPTIFPPELNSTVESGATIRFNPSVLTLGPKETGQVVAHFTAPQDLDASRIPVYSGYIQINGTNGDALSVPYGGIASRLKNATILDPPHFAVTSSDGSTEPFYTYQNFTLPSKAVPTGVTVVPSVELVLAMGTRILRVDIVPDNLNGVPRIVGQQTIGSIAGFPMEYTLRGGFNIYPWEGQLADGTFAPEGNYTFLVRALKIFGNADYDHDYESYRSVLFGIKYLAQP